MRRLLLVASSAALFVGALFATLSSCALHAQATQRKPNIVFIMADELGYFELSCMGHPHIKTPNIDRLAAEGMRFTQCLAGSPLCAPTRCSLLTGKHSGHTSVRTNGGGTPLRAGEATIGTVLKSAGYATGGFGKWGCGGRGSTGVPEQHGFDTFVGYYDQVHAHTYYPAHILRNSEEVPLKGNAGGRKGETYAHYVIVDEAKKFIRASKDRPFFCYMPVTPPHGMFDIPETDPAWQIYKDEDWPLEARRYAAMVTMLDRQVGEVIALLGELGLTDDTLVMFGGDNGGNDYFRDADHPRGFHAPNVDPKTKVEFRGTKGKVYEGGLRVPMIAWWPGKIRAGQVSDHLSYFPDLMPTFAEVARASTPDDTDGISMLPTLIGAEAAGRQQARHTYLYWELGGQVAVRMGAWKAIRARKNADWCLYDLATDISETKDLAKEQPQVLAQMRAYAEAAHEEAVPGTFADRSMHEKDRRARGAVQRRRRQSAPGPVERLPTAGLVARDDWKVVRVSSEHGSTGKLADRMLDGKPRTHWHTRFSPELDKHPHEVLIDMGEQRVVRAIAYLARQDRGWNGALGRCEFFVGDDAATVGTPDTAVLTTTFAKTKAAQVAELKQPAKGRYLLLRVLSEVQGGPWASIAELGVVGK